MAIVLIIVAVELLVAALGKTYEYIRRPMMAGDANGMIEAIARKKKMYAIWSAGIGAVVLVILLALFVFSPMEQFKRAMRDKDAYKANYIYQSMSEGQKEQAMKWAEEEIPYIVEELRKAH